MYSSEVQLYDYALSYLIIRRSRSTRSGQSQITNIICKERCLSLLTSFRTEILNSYQTLNIQQIMRKLHLQVIIMETYSLVRKIMVKDSLFI